MQIKRILTVLIQRLVVHRLKLQRKVQLVAAMLRSLLDCHHYGTIKTNHFDLIVLNMVIFQDII